MSGLNITVSGEGALKDAFDKLAGRMEIKLRDAVQSEAEAIADDERAMVPVASGALRAGIETRADGLSAEVGIYDPELIYAIWIEWGRSSAAAQPFATPAAEQSQNRWPKRASDAVKEAI